MEQEPESFLVCATGQISHAKLPGKNRGYCKIQYKFGEDWEVLDGFDAGITQISRGKPQVVWNFPLDISFRAANPFGWPQIVLTVYTFDAFGIDVVYGYGCIHLPAFPGRYVFNIVAHPVTVGGGCLRIHWAFGRRYELQVALYRPVSVSRWHNLTSWLRGMPPEYADPKFPASADGRHVTRVVSQGSLTAQLSITTKDMDKFGFEVPKLVSQPLNKFSC